MIVILFFNGCDCHNSMIYLNTWFDSFKFWPYVQWQYYFPGFPCIFGVEKPHNACTKTDCLSQRKLPAKSHVWFSPGARTKHQKSWTPSPPWTREPEPYTPSTLTLNRRMTLKSWLQTYKVEARKLEHYSPHALNLKYKESCHKSSSTHAPSLCLLL